MAIKVDLEDFPAVVAAMGPKFEKAAVRGLQSAAYELEGMTKLSISATSPYPPEDTGELKRSVHTTKTKTGANVSADAPHAPYMEYGTRPHFPPLKPLAEWAYRKGLADSEEEAEKVAMAVALKIQREGIEPRHFMARAIKELERRKTVKKEIVRELKSAGLPRP